MNFFKNSFSLFLLFSFISAIKFQSKSKTIQSPIITVTPMYISPLNKPNLYLNTGIDYYWHYNPTTNQGKTVLLSAKKELFYVNLNSNLIRNFFIGNVLEVFIYAGPGGCKVPNFLPIFKLADLVNLSKTKWTFVKRNNNIYSIITNLMTFVQCFQPLVEKTYALTNNNGEVTIEIYDNKLDSQKWKFS